MADDNEETQLTVEEVCAGLYELSLSVKNEEEREVLHEAISYIQYQQAELTRLESVSHLIIL